MQLFVFGISGVLHRGDYVEIKLRVSLRLVRLVTRAHPLVSKP